MTLKNCFISLGLLISFFLMLSFDLSTKADSVSVTVKVIQNHKPLENQQIVAFNYNAAYEKLQQGKISDETVKSQEWQTLQQNFPGANNTVLLQGNVSLGQNIKLSAKDALTAIELLYSTGNFQVLQDIEGVSGLVPNAAYNQQFFMNFTDKQGETTQQIRFGPTIFANASIDSLFLKLIVVTKNTSHETFTIADGAQKVLDSGMTSDELSSVSADKEALSTAQKDKRPVPKSAMDSIVLPIIAVVVFMLLIMLFLLMRRDKVRKEMPDESEEN